METRQQVFENVCRILAKQLEIDPETLHEDTRVVDDLGADSLDIVELTMTLEERYNIIITNDQAAQLPTIGKIVDFIVGYFEKK
ncbi:MAG: acyl carrier protein [Oscillospiraceae bacterium]